MKKISLLILISVLATIGFAQQFPLQSQYQFNYPTINPAASGENDFYRARASFREQWVGLTDKPISTQILTITKGFGSNGLGITIFNDKTGGAFNKSGGALSYSYRIQVSESYFAFGVSAGVSKINLSALDDPALLTNDNVIPDFTFGMYYTLGDLKLGLSIPGLIKANMDFTDSDQNTLDRHFYTMISYSKKLNDDWSAHPSVLVKTTSLNNQVDANINFKLKNKLWFGTSYRQDFGPTIYVGIDFGKLLSVYSFDVSTNEVADYSSGSHEFTLGYDFIPDLEEEVKNIDKEELLNDRDKDGIADEEDFCPDVPGSKLANGCPDFDNDGVEDDKDLCPYVSGNKFANGCPDFDKDGIPDKYDLCPHLYGSTKSQGCPELTNAEKIILTRALSDLKFNFDKDEIEQVSYIALTELTVLLHKNPSMNLLIEGHASAEGSATYNLSLSARRAKAVQNFFISRGISKGRLNLDFYGEGTPLNNNINEEERADNRRVEFDIRYHLFDEKSANVIFEEYKDLLNKIGGILEKDDKVEVPTESVESSYSKVKNESNISQTLVEELKIDKQVKIESDISDTQFEEVKKLDEKESDIIIFSDGKDELDTNDILINLGSNEQVKIESNQEKTVDEVVEITDAQLNIEPYTAESKSVINYESSKSSIDHKYLVIVQVFNDVGNALDYTNSKEKKLEYIYVNESYYIFAFGSDIREKAEKFRDNYGKDSWILDL